MNLIYRAYAALDFGVGNKSIVKTGTDAPTNVQSLVTSLTGIISIIAAVLAFFFLIYSGFLYLTANGNPDQAKKGQSGIINAIIGLVIIALAYWIVTAVVGSLTSIQPSK